jgi:hypothetical protein
MVLVVLGIDALDPDIVTPERHPHLTLEDHRPIESIDSYAGEPSTHELWPSIITGLSPDQHGLQLSDGMAWENPVLQYGSLMADYVLPQTIQTKLGAWILTNTAADAFRVPASYYAEHDLQTVFDNHQSTAIGIPNYVVNPELEDREHSLRRDLGDLFQRDSEAIGGHTTSDISAFFEQCMEMASVRIARARSAVQFGCNELVFAYTSGLDLIGHVTYDDPAVQQQAYDEINGFVADLIDDLNEDDDLLLVSDHGLQEGVHTHEAMAAATDPGLLNSVESITDIKATIEKALNEGEHLRDNSVQVSQSDEGRDEVQARLEDLGYM